MKYDSSRFTFDKLKRYSRVFMQQGRVQLDADWNEQGEIIAHRIETEAADVIGLCGAPMHAAGFQISPRPVLMFETAQTARSAASDAIPIDIESSPDFLIGAGRYYVDGILCENPSPTSYVTQPDFPGAKLVTAAGWYVVYLDVWLRHITALDDRSIREVALGGPDTATRAKTIWQVKRWYAGNDEQKITCLSSSEDLLKVFQTPSGRMSARTTPQQVSTNPCVVPPGAGYRGLENQLYRVEVHRGGKAMDVATAGRPTPITQVANTVSQARFSAGSWEADQAVEIVSDRAGADPLDATLTQVTAVDSRANTVTLNINVAAVKRKALLLRPVEATFKWSRDNGVVVTAIENINGQDVTVHDLGPDEVLGFQDGQWVEITDDTNDLNGTPGLMAQIVHADRATNIVTLSAAPPPLVTRDGVPDTSAHPRMRRWDGFTAIKFNSGAADGGWLDLENGVQVHFDAGTYRTGDYWTFPARTANADELSGNIEWPTSTSGAPLAQRPAGIRHHYCRLAVLYWNGRNYTTVSDCRKLFPPLAELTTLRYVSGDGQEAMPYKPIPQLLRAGVFNGREPVPGVLVRFETSDGGHLAHALSGLSIAGPSVIDAPTGTDGIASCAWLLNPDEAEPSQHVDAHLLDAEGSIIQRVPTVGYNGNLSIASQVSYNPANCPDLARAGVATVEAALNELCEREDDCECAVCVSPDEHNSGRKTIQHAIEEAKRKNGGKICLKAGVYFVNETIVLHGAFGITITGHDVAGLLFSGTGPVISVRNSVDVTIEHLIVLRRASEGNAGGVGIEIRDCLMDTEVSDCLISLYEAKSNVFASLLPAGVSQGVGIRLAGLVQNVHLLRNAIAAGVAVGTMGADRLCGLNIEVRENLMLSGKRGVALDCLGLTANIEQNWIVVDTLPTALGIALTGPTAAGGAVMIDGNNIVSAGGGISFTTSATTVSNNMLTGASRPDEWSLQAAADPAVASAIMLGAALRIRPRDVKILANRIAWFRGHGVCFTGAVASAMVKQNSIADIGGGGIVAKAGAAVARLSVENNDIERVGLAAHPVNLPAAGIGLVGGGDIDISHNRIAGVGVATLGPSHGIHLFAPKRARVAGNSISGVMGAQTGTAVATRPSAAIEIAGAYGTAEIVENDVQSREGEWQAILVTSGRFQTQPDLGGWVYQYLDSTALRTATARTFSNYVIFYDGAAFTLSSAEQALIVRSNVLQRVVPGPHSLVEIATSGTCTFGANDCRAIVSPQATPPTPLVALTAETAIVDSNHLIGSANAMNIAGTKYWTVLGNVYQGAITVPDELGEWDKWAKFNRPV